MIRFIIAAMLWMLASFALLWWVQMAVDAMHRDAVEVVGRSVQFDPAANLKPGDDASQLLASARRNSQAAPEDLARLEFDRRELMRRLRVLWIGLTLLPVLVGAWWVMRTPLAGSRL